MAVSRSSKTAPRPRRPKAEVQKEFTELSREVKAAAEDIDAKADELAKVKEAEVREEVAGITVEGVVERMSSLGLEVTRSLAGLSGKLVEEVGRLTSIRAAVELEKRELERLHKIDVAATALDQMVQEYSHEKERLEAEIASRRAEWEEEARVAERDRKEQEESLKKQRQREIEDYEYKKSLDRKKAQDKYEEELRLVEKSNKEKQEALGKSWSQREAALKAQEEEYARLKKEAEGFPARLQKEIDQAAARAVVESEARFTQQIQLLKKDAEVEGRMAELRIKTLEETISRQSAQIEALQKHLDEAKHQVQDIAVKAIEGASGARALAHVGQIAMEQAKTRSPQG
jgi:hypothetical protein